MKIKSILLVGLLSTPAWAGPDTKPVPTDTKTSDTKSKLSEDEVNTLKHVHHVNQMEIDLAKVAQKQGSPAIQKYAAMIVKDHQSADSDVMALAKKKGVTVTAATDEDMQADKDMKTMADHLKTLKGADFDKEYASMMADGHSKEVGKIDAAISSGSDTEVKGLLEKIKPVVQKHADDAKALGKSNS